MADQLPNFNDMVSRFAEDGLLAKKLYVYFTTPTNGLGPVMENVKEHLAYQHEIEQKGIMVAAGPFADDDDEAMTGEGMIIIRAASLKEARAVADADPMHKAGARSYRLRPWCMNEGKITIEVTFSDGARKVI
jgi:uncharacterized protein YciI